MADFADEIQRLMTEPLPGQGKAPSFVDEINRLMTGPAPQDTPDAYGLLPQGEAGADPSRLNARFPVRAAGRLAVQVPATAAGFAGGTAMTGGNPLGGLAGAALLGTAAGQGYDYFTGGEPSIPSAAIDAVTSAAGPAAPMLARGAGRAIAGLTKPVRQQSQAAGNEAFTETFGALQGQGANPMTSVVEAMHTAAAAQTAAATRLAQEAARQTASGQASALLNNSHWAGMMAGLASGRVDMAALAWLGTAGAAPARRAAAETLLKNPEVVGWLLRNERAVLEYSKGAAGRRVLGSMAGQVALSRDEEGALGILTEGPTNTLLGPQRRATPFDKILTPQGAEIGRDRRTGRFIAIEDTDNG